MESLTESILLDLKNNLLKPMAKELEGRIDNLQAHTDTKISEVDSRFSRIEESISKLDLSIGSQKALFEPLSVNSSKQKLVLLFLGLCCALQFLTIGFLVVLFLMK